MMRLVRNGFWSALLVLSTHGLSAEAPVAIKDAWIRQMPPGIANTSAFFEISNQSVQPLTLVSVTSPAAKEGELHETIQQGPFTTMNEVSKVTIPPKESFALKPGGTHVMLLGLSEKLEEGKEIPLVLKFADGSTVEVRAKVKNP